MHALWLVIGWLVCLLVLIWQFHRFDLQAGTAVLVVGVATVVGLFVSKLLYILFFWDSTVTVLGWESFITASPDTFTVFGLLAGGVIGACLAALIIKTPASLVLDLFTPCMAIFLAFLRIGEKELGSIGFGHYLNPESPFACFPFAVMNDYGEHYYAVFLLEALLALVCGVVWLCRSGTLAHGRVAEGCCFYLALPQIFCESIRVRCLKWGFVRTEQVLCAALILVLLFIAGKRVYGLSKKRFFPFVVGVLCIAAVGLTEYALDKSDLPVWCCYLAMVILLLIPAYIEFILLKQDAIRQKSNDIEKR